MNNRTSIFYFNLKNKTKYSIFHVAIICVFPLYLVYKLINCRKEIHRLLYSLLFMSPIHTGCPGIYTVHTPLHTGCPRIYTLHTPTHTGCPEIYTLHTTIHTVCPRIYTLHTPIHTGCRGIYTLHIYTHKFITV